uniref:CST complex subunit STN1 n=1 Tax=Ananas comosus var. bracteatus TaxID=296719 RepID=A0A6V7PGC6_ANACO|nr:unnamed protein product [Ananas comosus var. bracteatus]
MQVIFAKIQDMEFLDHCPSPLVAATIICAIDETPAVAFINPGIVVTWCVGLTEAAAECVDAVRLGALVRVRGRVGVYRGAVQITVADEVVEKDPNSEVLHWLDCIRLARDYYDVV